MQVDRDQKNVRTAEHFFGLALREHRKVQGITQEELAFHSGYHPTYIGQLERGAKSPSLRTILKLSSVLNTSASKLIERVEFLLSQPSA
jgi:transcriptional regulator with XRE-family HTH domain